MQPKGLEGDNGHYVQYRRALLNLSTRFNAHRLDYHLYNQSRFHNLSPNNYCVELAAEEF
jgi:hypothetical protein